MFSKDSYISYIAIYKLEDVSELKYLIFVFDGSGTDRAECCMNVASVRKVEGAGRSLVSAKSWFMTVFIHGNKTMV